MADDSPAALTAAASNHSSNEESRSTVEESAEEEEQSGLEAAEDDEQSSQSGDDSDDRGLSGVSAASLASDAQRSDHVVDEDIDDDHDNDDDDEVSSQTQFLDDTGLLQEAVGSVTVVAEELDLTHEDLEMEQYLPPQIAVPQSKSAVLDRVVEQPKPAIIKHYNRDTYDDRPSLKEASSSMKPSSSLITDQSIEQSSSSMMKINDEMVADSQIRAAQPPKATGSRRSQSPETSTTTATSSSVSGVTATSIPTAIPGPSLKIAESEDTTLASSERSGVDYRLFHYDPLRESESVVSITTVWDDSVTAPSNSSVVSSGTCSDSSGLMLHSPLATDATADCTGKPRPLFHQFPANGQPYFTRFSSLQSGSQTTATSKTLKKRRISPSLVSAGLSSSSVPSLPSTGDSTDESSQSPGKSRPVSVMSVSNDWMAYIFADEPRVLRMRSRHTKQVKQWFEFESSHGGGVDLMQPQTTVDPRGSPSLSSSSKKTRKRSELSAMIDVPTASGPKGSPIIDLQFSPLQTNIVAAIHQSGLVEIFRVAIDRQPLTNPEDGGLLMTSGVMSIPVARIDGPFKVVGEPSLKMKDVVLKRSIVGNSDDDRKDDLGEEKEDKDEDNECDDQSLPMISTRVSVKWHQWARNAVYVTCDRLLSLFFWTWSPDPSTTATTTMPHISDRLLAKVTRLWSVEQHFRIDRELIKLRDLDESQRKSLQSKSYGFGFAHGTKLRPTVSAVGSGGAGSSTTTATSGNDTTKTTTAAAIGGSDEQELFAIEPNGIISISTTYDRKYLVTLNGPLDREFFVRSQRESPSGVSQTALKFRMMPYMCNLNVWRLPSPKQMAAFVNSGRGSSSSVGLSALLANGPIKEGSRKKGNTVNPASSTTTTGTTTHHSSRKTSKSFMPKKMLEIDFGRLATLYKDTESKDWTPRLGMCCAVEWLLTVESLARNMRKHVHDMQKQGVQSVPKSSMKGGGEIVDSRYLASLHKMYYHPELAVCIWRVTFYPMRSTQSATPLRFVQRLKIVTPTVNDFMFDLHLSSYSYPFLVLSAVHVGPQNTQRKRQSTVVAHSDDPSSSTTVTRGLSRLLMIEIGRRPKNRARLSSEWRETLRSSLEPCMSGVYWIDYPSSLKNDNSNEVGSAAAVKMNVSGSPFSMLSSLACRKSGASSVVDIKQKGRMQYMWEKNRCFTISWLNNRSELCSMEMFKSESCVLSMKDLRLVQESLEKAHKRLIPFEVIECYPRHMNFDFSVPIKIGKLQMNGASSSTTSSSSKTTATTSEEEKKSSHSASKMIDSAKMRPLSHPFPSAMVSSSSSNMTTISEMRQPVMDPVINPITSSLGGRAAAIVGGYIGPSLTTQDGITLNNNNNKSPALSSVDSLSLSMITTGPATDVSSMVSLPPPTSSAGSIASRGSDAIPSAPGAIHMTALFESENSVSSVKLSSAAVQGVSSDPVESDSNEPDLPPAPLHPSSSVTSRTREFDKESAMSSAMSRRSEEDERTSLKSHSARGIADTASKDIALDDYVALPLPTVDDDLDTASHRAEASMSVRSARHKMEAQVDRDEEDSLPEIPAVSSHHSSSGIQPGMAPAAIVGELGQPVLISTASSQAAHDLAGHTPRGPPRPPAQLVALDASFVENLVQSLENSLKQEIKQSLSKQESILSSFAGRLDNIEHTIESVKNEQNRLIHHHHHHSAAVRSGASAEDSDAKISALAVSGKDQPQTKPELMSLQTAREVLQNDFATVAKFLAQTMQNMYDRRIIPLIQTTLAGSVSAASAAATAGASGGGSGLTRSSTGDSMTALKPSLELKLEQLIARYEVLKEEIHSEMMALTNCVLDCHSKSEDQMKKHFGSTSSELARVKDRCSSKSIGKVVRDSLNLSDVMKAVSEVKTVCRTVGSQVSALTEQSQKRGDSHSKEVKRLGDSLKRNAKKLDGLFDELGNVVGGLNATSAQSAAAAVAASSSDAAVSASKNPDATLIGASGSVSVGDLTTAAAAMTGDIGGGSSSSVVKMIPLGASGTPSSEVVITSSLPSQSAADHPSASSSLMNADRMGDSALVFHQQTHHPRHPSTMSSMMRESSVHSRSQSMPASSSIMGVSSQTTFAPRLATGLAASSDQGFGFGMPTSSLASVSDQQRELHELRAIVRKQEERLASMDAFGGAATTGSGSTASSAMFAGVSGPPSHFASHGFGFGQLGMFPVRSTSQTSSMFGGGIDRHSSSLPSAMRSGGISVPHSGSSSASSTFRKRTITNPSMDLPSPLRFGRFLMNVPRSSLALIERLCNPMFTKLSTHQWSKDELAALTAMESQYLSANPSSSTVGGPAGGMAGGTSSSAVAGGGAGSGASGSVTSASTSVGYPSYQPFEFMAKLSEQSLYHCMIFVLERMNVFELYQCGFARDSSLNKFAVSWDFSQVVCGYLCRVLVNPKEVRWDQITNVDLCAMISWMCVILSDTDFNDSDFDPSQFTNVIQQITNNVDSFVLFHQHSLSLSGNGHNLSIVREFLRELVSQLVRQWQSYSSSSLD